MCNYLSFKRTFYILGVLALFPFGKLYSQYLTGDYYSYFPNSKNHAYRSVSRISFLPDNQFEFCYHSTFYGYSSNTGSYKMKNRIIYFYKDESSNQLVTYGTNKDNFLTIHLKDFLPTTDSFLVLIKDYNGNFLKYTISNTLKTSDDIIYPIQFIVIDRQNYSQRIIITKEIEKFSQIEIDIVNTISDSSFPYDVTHRKYRVRKGGRILKSKYTTFKRLME